MRPGSIVHHLRSARRMFIESIDGRVVFCAWFDSAGELHRGAYGIDWVCPVGMALA